MYMPPCLLVLSILILVPEVLSSPTSAEHGRGRFSREHVNDLDTLLKAVSVGGYVVFTEFSVDYRELGSNWYFTITHFGRVPSLLVAAFDERSLVECMILGFPCFNATILAPSSNITESFGYGSGAYYRLTWGKALMIHHILIRGYSPITSDMDTVWFKDVIHSFAGAADFHDADVIGMDDDGHNKPNAGNMYFKNNRRTRALAEAWVNLGYDLQKQVFTPNGSLIGDQEGLWNLKGISWDPCSNASHCLSVKAQGKAATWLNPWHGCPGGQQPCEGHLAYLHLFCTGGGVAHKKIMAIEKKYWFVGFDAGESHMIGAKATELINATHHWRFSPEAAQENRAMPCKNTVPNWF